MTSGFEGHQIQLMQKSRLSDLLRCAGGCGGEDKVAAGGVPRSYAAAVSAGDRGGEQGHALAC